MAAGIIGDALVGLAYQAGRGIGTALRVVRDALRLPATDADGALVPTSASWPDAADHSDDGDVTDVPVVFAE